MELKAKVKEDRKTGQWAAELTAFGLNIQGPTPDEALTSLYDAISDLVPGLAFDLAWTDKQRGRALVKTSEDSVVIDAIMRQGRGP